MANSPRSKLCVLCVDVCNDPSLNLVHVIHPVTGMQMLFDSQGEAVCPICHAKWRRERNVMSLVQ